MNIENIELFYFHLSELQNKFDIELSQKIFGVNLGTHLYDKWLFYESNLLEFMNRLDFNNKDKLFQYILMNILEKNKKSEISQTEKNKINSYQSLPISPKKKNIIYIDDIQDVHVEDLDQEYWCLNGIFFPKYLSQPDRIMLETENKNLVLSCCSLTDNDTEIVDLINNSNSKTIKNILKMHYQKNYAKLEKDGNYYYNPIYNDYNCYTNKSLEYKRRAQILYLLNYHFNRKDYDRKEYDINYRFINEITFLDWYELKNKPYILNELDLFLEKVIFQYDFLSYQHVLSDIKVYIENMIKNYKIKDVDTELDFFNLMLNFLIKKLRNENKGNLELFLFSNLDEFNETESEKIRFLILYIKLRKLQVKDIRNNVDLIRNFSEIYFSENYFSNIQDFRRMSTQLQIWSKWNSENQLSLEHTIFKINEKIDLIHYLNEEKYIEKIIKNQIYPLNEEIYEKYDIKKLLIESFRNFSDYIEKLNLKNYTKIVSDYDLYVIKELIKILEK